MTPRRTPYLSCLRPGADPNVCRYDGEFRELPIYAAAGIANSPELTRLLLAAGADPKETYEDLCVPRIPSAALTSRVAQPAA
jgi:hypothetical protein